MTLKNWFLSLCCLFAGGCSGQAPADAESPSSDQPVWNAELNYQFLSDAKNLEKQAVKAAKASKAYRNYYPRFAVGNLVIVEGSTPAPPQLLDASGKYGYLGVVVGKKAQAVVLPNDTLLNQYVVAVRQNNDWTLERRVNLLFLLAIGENPALMARDMAEAQQMWSECGVTPVDPEWIDDGKTLTVKYYRYLSDSPMTAPQPYRCLFTYHADGTHTNTCDYLRSGEEDE